MGQFGAEGFRPRMLAEMLREFGIQPHPMRLTGSGSQMLRGYFRADFNDAWERYLPASEKGVTEVISVNEQEGFEKAMTNQRAEARGFLRTLRL